MLYKIYFKDGTTFFGGRNLQDSKWNEMPDKPILCLEILMFQKPLVLTNFEWYLFAHEIGCLFNRTKIITKVFIMGKRGNEVTKYTYDVLKNRLYKDITDSEHYYQTPINGWKSGI